MPNDSAHTFLEAILRSSDQAVLLVDFLDLRLTFCDDIESIQKVDLNGADERPNNAEAVLSDTDSRPFKVWRWCLRQVAFPGAARAASLNSIVFPGKLRFVICARATQYGSARSEGDPIETTRLTQLVYP